MNVSRLVRSPIAFVILVELAVALVAGAVTWHLRQGSSPLAIPAGLPAPQAGGPVTGPPISALPTPPADSGQGGRPALPGLNGDPGFLGTHLRDANHDEATLEQSEWRVTRLIQEGVLAYIDHVVTPAVNGATESARKRDR
jgi:hypothetical protein